MAELIVNRAKYWGGSLASVDCYVDNKRVLQVENGETRRKEIGSGVVQFFCKLSTAITKPAPVYLDLDARDTITVDVRMTMSGLQVNIVDKDAIVKPGSQKALAVRNNVAVSNVSPSRAVFTPTKAVKNYFAIDDNNQRWCVGRGLVPSLSKGTVYDYEDLIDFDLLEDGTSIARGGVGRAVAGGLMFGGVGAIVGASTPKKSRQKCTMLAIRITTKNANAPMEMIKLITSPTDKSGQNYKIAFNYAQEIVSLLQYICSVRDEAANAANSEEAARRTPSRSVADEIREFKALLDDGIITEEEFQKKKQQLLGL